MWGLTFGLRSENTPGRPAVSGQVLGLEGGGTAFALGADLELCGMLRAVSP